MIFQKKEIKDDTNKFLIVDSEINMNNSKDETKKHDISFDSDKFVKNKKEFFKNHIGYTLRIILNSIIPIITLILSILFINLALNSNVKEISTIKWAMSGFGVQAAQAQESTLLRTKSQQVADRRSTTCCLRAVACRSRR